MEKNADRITIDLKDCQKTLPQLLSSKRLPTLNMKVLLVADFNDDGVEEVLVLITERNNKQRLAYFTLSGSQEDYFTCPLSPNSPAQLLERREYFSTNNNSNQILEEVGENNNNDDANQMYPGNSFLLPNGMYVAPTFGVDGMIKKPKISFADHHHHSSSSSLPEAVATQLFNNNNANSNNNRESINSKFKPLPRDQGIKMTEIRLFGLPLSANNNNNTNTNDNNSAADPLQQQQSATNEQENNNNNATYTIVDVHVVNQRDSLASASQLHQHQSTTAMRMMNNCTSQIASPTGTASYYPSSTSSSMEFNNNNTNNNPSSSSSSIKLGGLLIVLMEGLVVHIPARAFQLQSQQQVFIPVGGHLAENAFIIANSNNSNNPSENDTSNAGVQQQQQTPLTTDSASSGGSPTMMGNNNNTNVNSSSSSSSTCSAAITQILSIHMNQLEAVWQIPWNCCCSSVDSSFGIPHTVFCGFPCGLILSMPMGQHGKTIVASSSTATATTSGNNNNNSNSLVKNTTSIPIISTTASTPANSKQPISVPVPSTNNTNNNTVIPSSVNSNGPNEHLNTNNTNQPTPSLQKNPQLTSMVSMSNLPNLLLSSAASTPPASVPSNQLGPLPTALPPFNNNNTSSIQQQQQIHPFNIPPPIIPASTYASAITVTDAPTRISTIFYAHDKEAVMIGTAASHVLVDKQAFAKASFSQKIQDVQMHVKWGLQAACLSVECFQSSPTTAAWAVVTEAGNVLLFSIDFAGTVSKSEFKIFTSSSSVIHHHHHHHVVMTTNAVQSNPITNVAAVGGTPNILPPQPPTNNNSSTSPTPMMMTSSHQHHHTQNNNNITNTNPPRFVKIALDSDDQLCVIVIHENGSVTICDKARRYVHAAIGSGGTSIRVQSAHQCVVAGRKQQLQQQSSATIAYPHHNPLASTTPARTSTTTTSTHLAEPIPTFGIRRSHSNVNLSTMNNNNNMNITLAQPSGMLLSSSASSSQQQNTKNSNNSNKNTTSIELLLVDNCYIRKISVSLPVLAYAQRTNSSEAWEKLAKFAKQNVVNPSTRNISIFALGDSLVFDNHIIEQIRLEKKLLQQKQQQKQQQQQAVIKKGSEAEEEQRRLRLEQQMLSGSFVADGGAMNNNNKNRSQTSTSLNLEEFEE